MQKLDERFLGSWIDKVTTEVVSFTNPNGVNGVIVGKLNGKIQNGDWSVRDSADQNGTAVKIIDIFVTETKGMHWYIYRFDADGNKLYLLKLNQELFCTLHKL